MAQRYFIQLSYDGTDFHGWQIQPNAKTIQETLNDALSTLFRQDIYCVGCGRTDTGVHAKFFIAHIELDHSIELECTEVIYRLNRILPKSIAVQDCYSVAEDAHARFSAISRSYAYFITTVKDPFSVDRMWELRESLNITAMNEAANSLLGEHDFSCFSKSNTQTETNLCKVSEAYWEEHPHGLVFLISANRFLRNMVRAVVGTLVEVGREKLSLSDFQAVLASKDRSAAGTSVPAHGLYLTNVVYPEGIRSNGQG
jgi:tRNA pseudouridine38-40 synthase